MSARQNISPYHANLRIPQTNLFEYYSIDFAGPFPASTSSMRFLLVIVEHKTAWFIIIASSDATSEALINFLKENIVYDFEVQAHIFSNNGQRYTSMKFHLFACSNSIK